MVMNTFSENDWIENFRVSRTTFIYLCNEIRTEIEKKDTVMRKACTVENRVGVTIWFLSTGSDFRTINHLFGISKSLVCLIVREVCHAVCKTSLPKYITFPQGDKLWRVVEGFKNKYGFPQCVGAIDGSHIQIISPNEFPADCFKRKGWHSVILKGTVNDLGMFVDINIGWPGRVHDARVFSNFNIYKKCQEGSLLPDWTINIHGESIPLLLLGDPAYPLQPWLMKPFINNGQLSDVQKNFNYRLSHTRVVVEHAYGRLKGRWRCLLKRLDVNISHVPEVVASCCVLHNICEVHGDSFNNDWLEGIAINSSSSTIHTHTISNNNGESSRKALMIHFET